MKITLLAFLLALPVFCIAQTNTTTAEDDAYFDITEVQIKPAYPGGMEAMYKHIQKNFKWPPEDLREGNSGRIFLQFVVGKDGKVTDVKVVRGINDRLDAEAIRVLKTMKKWKPGYKDGKAVRVRYSMPIALKGY